jgi:hypothetical protein
MSASAIKQAVNSDTSIQSRPRNPKILRDLRRGISRLEQRHRIANLGPEN